MTEVIETDAGGNVIMKPLTGYTTAPVADMFVLARLEYASSPDHLQMIMTGTGKADAVQLALSPLQARELAERLNFLADHIMSQKTPNPTNTN